jgi:NDP-sugar pyrophosphorylase family protein
MKILLLSAGLGTRLRPLTDRMPKVMVQVAGKPCLQRHIENFRRQGIEDFAINTHYQPEAIRRYFGDGSQFGVKITYSYEPILLGTAGALTNFRDFFQDDSFIVVYADVVADFDIKPALQVHSSTNSGMTIALDNSRDMGPRGAVFFEGHRVRGFIEKPGRELEGAAINSGFYIVKPEVLGRIPEGFSDFGKDILPKLIKEGKVSCFMHRGYIFDVGTPDDLKKAGDFLRKT